MHDTSKPMLSFDIPCPERWSRLVMLFRGLFIIPHVIALCFLYIALSVVWFIAWFAILFTGRYPHGLWDFSMMVLRWQANVLAYAAFQRDEYPPFGRGDYPVRFDLEYPTHLSRWKVLVKWLLVVPHALILYPLIFVWCLVSIVAWFNILSKGRYPRDLFDFSTGVQRWLHRVSVYNWLLTDAYPPFSLG
ncbi:MAG: DUF4389 domain-containing protein [Chloroflexota bacterium]